ncbi:hypothetical protein [Mycobacterium paraense]|uniref:hypothetical protein n=1 Tax=Mycobacterium paraense TaxID=767916 RepID=UPI001F4E6DB5|nr:hypothetical protein [Mycobacterium paraense]
MDRQVGIQGPGSLVCDESKRPAAGMGRLLDLGKDIGDLTSLTSGDDSFNVRELQADVCT